MRFPSAFVHFALTAAAVIFLMQFLLPPISFASLASRLAPRLQDVHRSKESGSLGRYVMRLGRFASCPNW